MQRLYKLFEKSLTLSVTRNGMKDNQENTFIINYFKITVKIRPFRKINTSQKGCISIFQI